MAYIKAIVILNPKDEFDLRPFAKIGITIVFWLQFCEMRVRKRKTECDYFFKERGVLWYETDAVVSLCAVTKVFWLPSFCLVLWRWGWRVNDWNVFLLSLVYLWDCILQQDSYRRTWQKTTAKADHRKSRTLTAEHDKEGTYSRTSHNRTRQKVGLLQQNTAKRRTLTAEHGKT